MGAVVIVIVALAAVGGLGELGLAAAYARVWARLSERRPRR